MRKSRNWQCYNSANSNTHTHEHVGRILNFLLDTAQREEKKIALKKHEFNFITRVKEIQNSFSLAHFFFEMLNIYSCIHQNSYSHFRNLATLWNGRIANTKQQTSEQEFYIIFLLHKNKKNGFTNNFAQTNSHTHTLSNIFVIYYSEMKNGSN